MEKIILALAVLFLFSCKEEDPPEPYNIFAGCCNQTNPIKEVGQGKLYVPSLITPNGDGLNDGFVLTANSGIDHFENLEIKNQLGVLLYEKSFIDASSNEGWFPTGVLGTFRYSFTAYDTLGFNQSFLGTACAITCDTTASGVTKANCFLPDQYLPSSDSIVSSSETCIQ